jgi:hypothetical protein
MGKIMRGHFINYRSSGSRIELPEKISIEVLPKRFKKNKENLKLAIDQIKQLLLSEESHKAKVSLAKAGLELNRLLLSE